MTIEQCKKMYNTYENPGYQNESDQLLSSI